MCVRKIELQDKSKVIELLDRLLEELGEASEILKKANSIIEDILSASQTNDTQVYRQFIIMMEQLNTVHKKATDISTFWPQLSDKGGHNIMLRLHSRLDNVFIRERSDMELYFQIIESAWGKNSNAHSPKKLKQSKDLLARSVYDYAKGMIKLANYYQISRIDKQLNA